MLRIAADRPKALARQIIVSKRPISVRRQLVGAGIGGGICLVAGFAAGATLIDALLFGALPGVVLGLSFAGSRLPEVIGDFLTGGW
jgi:hypothetical protein